MDEKEIKLEFTVEDIETTVAADAAKKKKPAERPVAQPKKEVSELSVPDKFTVNPKFGGIPEKKESAKPEKRKSNKADK